MGAAAVVAAEQEAWEERIEAAPRTVAAQRALLQEVSALYHPQHNMCVDLYYNLVPLLGRAPGPARPYDIAV